MYTLLYKILLVKRNEALSLINHNTLAFSLATLFFFRNIFCSCLLNIFLSMGTSSGVYSVASNKIWYMVGIILLLTVCSSLSNSIKRKDKHLLHTPIRILFLNMRVHGLFRWLMWVQGKNETKLIWC